MDNKFSFPTTRTVNALLSDYSDKSCDEIKDLKNRTGPCSPETQIFIFLQATIQLPCGFLVDPLWFAG
ncbi:MAG: hypothetical protein RAP03_11765 [Candidatus Electryonea clarkiae]|nr:hypothetical protein [Candidatus Electryonea clarkiae]